MGDMTEPTVSIQALIDQTVAARFDRLEAYCEAALVSGKLGVLIDGDNICLSERVPFGEIYDITQVVDSEDVVGWRS